LQKNHTIHRLTLAAVLCLATAASVPGCSKEAAAPEKPAAVAPTPGDRTYTTRGRITQLPLKGDARLGLRITHEEIPDFLDKTGKVVGMKAHDMGFPWVAADVSLEGFAVGDLVELTFEVRYNADERHTLTRLTKLPPETPVRL
jgi:hypothetical protein